MNFRKPPLLVCCLCVAALLLQGCTLLKKTGELVKINPQAAPATTNADASVLLGMSFDEAALIAQQHISVPHLPKVAADSIEVLGKYGDGTPRKIRAKGRVFLELDQQDHARALCDEAVVSGGEIILRGHPILQRASSTVEGMSDVTVFYLYGQSLRVIGKHRLTNLKDLAGASPWHASSSTNSYATLLPPLDSGDVPAAVRDEMRKAADAEAQLQRSRIGLPPAFPEATGTGLAPASDATKPVKEKEKKP